MATGAAIEGFVLMGTYPIRSMAPNGHHASAGSAFHTHWSRIDQK